jgi:hypothetical protein
VAAAERSAGRGGFAPGLALVTAALLITEIALTRILSVVMWYHFAFFALSIALFGLSVGGLVVHLLPRVFPAERLAGQAWGAAIALAVLAPASFLLLADNPAYRYLTSFNRPAGFGVGDALAMVALYVAGAIPFLAGGLVGALLFRHRGAEAGRLYAADLVGAGAGCLLAIAGLEAAGGPGALLVAGAFAALGAAAFARGAGRRGRLVTALVLATALGAAAAVQATNPFLAIKFSRGRELTGIRFEKWNSFSRVTVRDYGEPDSLLLQIDAASNTIIGRWDGRAESVRFLLDDLIAAPYALLPKPHVLVIGPGGGIDLAVARAAGAAAVTAVEVNPLIVEAMTGPFAAFSGGIYRGPSVRIETDEARSYIRRSDTRYDLIQAGYIDTYAATAAGAFALTENTLYTVEAYEDYLDHLAPAGIVAVQRYYEEPPQQTARLVALACEALRRRGVARPGAHVIVLRKDDRASVLVRPTPFAAADVAALEAWATAGGIELIAAPGRPGRGVYGEMLAAADYRDVVRAQALDLSAVGDDRPFFFYVVRPDVFWKGLLDLTGERVHARAVFLLVALLLTSAVLCAALALLPALARRDPRAPGEPRPLGAIAFFGALGLGFMLVEIGLLQRVLLFLGHPALALSVVLATLLVAAGLGARTTQGVALAASERALRIRLAAILGVVVVVAFALPPLFHALLPLPRAGRIAAAIVVLLPVGFALGQALPLALRRLATGRAELVPWAWSVNGGFSVFGSVLAMTIAINNGYTATILAGGLVYAGAWLLAPATRPTAAS